MDFEISRVVHGIKKTAETWDKKHPAHVVEYTDWMQYFKLL